VETSNPSFAFLYLYEIIKMIPLSHMITKANLEDVVALKKLINGAYRGESSKAGQPKLLC
jgi:hypothetical protein